MSDNATINTHTVPYTLLECPSCSKHFKQERALIRIRNAFKITYCTNCDTHLEIDELKGCKVTKIKVTEVI